MLARTPATPPGGAVPPPGELDRLVRAIAASRRLLVLSGAGCSTESGIPDYRDAEGEWKHRRPMSYQEFVGSAAARRRYWARSAVGWKRIADAEPNAAHRALARLERRGPLERLVTQNVDGLHQRAGSREVIDLHGRLDRVECLGCRATFDRRRFQRELERLNPCRDERPATLAPDGDAELDPGSEADFAVPPCALCGGVLKPGVVFFGESISRPRLESAYEAARSADLLLVVGSSVMVGSAFRLVREAFERSTPVVAVNLGRTRVDERLELRVEAPCGAVLSEVVRRLG